MIPNTIRKLPRALGTFSRRVGTRRHCPICEHDAGSFGPFGLKVRMDAAGGPS